MSKANKKKAEQLGMPVGTASNRLRKMILFDFVQRLELDKCFQCGDKISDIDNFSIEHPVPWLDSENSVELFFDLTNIAFSHLSCNVGAARRVEASHGTVNRFNKGCRCTDCREAKRKAWAKYQPHRKPRSGVAQTAVRLPVKEKSVGSTPTLGA